MATPPDETALPSVWMDTAQGRQWYDFYTVFEFDEAKSGSDKRKHGIDFVDAQALWDDPDRLEIPARTEGEARFLLIARIVGRHWSAVITYRGANIRIISVRRSRDEEVTLYEG